jgi:hypothetical protein
MKKKHRETVFTSDGTESRVHPGGRIVESRCKSPARRGTDMTLLNKSLMVAFMSAAVGFAAPALAQSGPAIYDTDEDSAVSVATNAPVVTNGSTTVVRADGSTVVTERVVTRRMVEGTACNFSDHRNLSGPSNVSGGIGGSIGGRMILGTTSRDDIPLPGNCGPIHR